MALSQYTRPRYTRQLGFALLLMLVSLETAFAQLAVETTTEDLAAITRSIGGDLVSVNSLTTGAADPHFAVAKPSMIRRVFKADLLISVGTGMEAGWLPALLQSSRNPRVLPGETGYLDLSSVVELKGILDTPASRALGDVHATGNPHYWLNPKNGLLMAAAIKDRLGILDSTNQSVYESRYQVFSQEIQSKLKGWRTQLNWLKDQPVIAYHRSFIYLADAFNFNIVDEVEPLPGISTSASALGRLVDKIKHDNIRLLIMEPYYERRSSRWLHEQTGIQVVILPQSVNLREGIETYSDLFDTIVARLSAEGDH